MIYLCNLGNDAYFYLDEKICVVPGVSVPFIAREMLYFFVDDSDNDDNDDSDKIKRGVFTVEEIYHINQITELESVVLRKIIDVSEL